MGCSMLSNSYRGIAAIGLLGLLGCTTPSYAAPVKLAAPVSAPRQSAAPEAILGAKMELYDRINGAICKELKVCSSAADPKGMIAIHFGPTYAYSSFVHAVREDIQGLQPDTGMHLLNMARNVAHMIDPARDFNTTVVQDAYAKPTTSIFRGNLASAYYELESARALSRSLSVDNKQFEEGMRAAVIPLALSHIQKGGLASLNDDLDFLRQQRRPLESFPQDDSARLVDALVDALYGSAARNVSHHSIVIANEEIDIADRIMKEAGDSQEKVTDRHMAFAEQLTDQASAFVDQGKCSAAEPLIEFSRGLVGSGGILGKRHDAQVRLNDLAQRCGR